MSGLDVAGLVLGALPLAVKGLKAYLELVSSLKNVRRDLQGMIRDIETERVLFQNTCESLLVDIVPPSKVDAMIEAPFGAEWKRYDDELRLRLWRSSDEFKKQVSEMKSAVEALEQKLCLLPNGQVHYTATYLAIFRIVDPSGRLV